MGAGSDESGEGQDSRPQVPSWEDKANLALRALLSLRSLISKEVLTPDQEMTLGTADEAISLLQAESQPEDFRFREVTPAEQTDLREKTQTRRISRKQAKLEAARKMSEEQG